MTDWIVSSAGRVGGAGTSTAPWSLAWALDPANTRPQPGDSVLLRGSTDAANPLRYPTPDADGFRPRRSGAAGRPITYAVHSGEFAEIDGDISPSLTWRLLVDRPGKRIWESNEPVRTPGNIYSIGGNIRIGARWFPLVPALATIGEGVQMTADSHDYRVDGRYYPGWMVERITATGKLRLRLDNPSSASMLGRPVPRLTSSDPARNRIALSCHGTGLSIGASHIRWMVPVANCHTPFRWDATRPRQSHWEICGTPERRGYDRCFYNSFSCGGLDDCQVHDWISHGDIQLDGNLAYWDFKGGATAAENVRKVAIRSGDIDGKFRASRWHFWRWEARGFFDIALGEGVDFEIGKLDPADTRSDERAWANRCTLWGIDDGPQLFASNQGWFVHHNDFPLAGVSRDGARSPRASGTRWPRIHKNLLYPRHRIFFGRKGAIDGDGRTNREGVCWPSPLSSHGIRAGGGDYSFPWSLTGNLIVVRGPNVNSGGPNAGASYFDMNLALAGAGRHEGGQNIIADNIFLVDGRFDLLWLSQRLRLGQGREVWTGNRFLTPPGSAVWAGQGQATSPMIRFVSINGVDLADPNGGNGWRDFAEIGSQPRAAAAALRDYAGGLQAMGGSVTSGSIASIRWIGPYAS